ncbi:GDP-D-glucose phosphorylase 1 [Blattella germanica]|nr:GDP-D-glucose phosphorylase 1 [Blattella germanica]
MIYSEDDFIFETKLDSHQKSKFDIKLQSNWNTAVEKGYFRYKLNITDSRILPGRNSYLIQLNPDRHVNRRVPEEIVCTTQPFNAEKFNFTKIKDEEYLFEINKIGKISSGHFLIINVSPLEYGHSLFVPSLFSCLPQVATLESIQLVIELLLLSNSPTLRIGFNGLCAYASVNHLHYHLYYLNQRMLLENIKVEHLSGSCYQLIDYPAPGFVFQLPENKSIQDLARDVYRLTNYFQNANQPYNVYMTRGSRFNTGSEYDTVRVYVWARKPTSEVKSEFSLKPAICELFGHFVVKAESDYWSATDEKLSSIIAEISVGPFADVRDRVKQLFEETK